MTSKKTVRIFGARLAYTGALFQPEQNMRYNVSDPTKYYKLRYVITQEQVVKLKQDCAAIIKSMGEKSVATAQAPDFRWPWQPVSNNEGLSKIKELEGMYYLNGSRQEKFGPFILSIADKGKVRAIHEHEKKLFQAGNYVVIGADFYMTTKGQKGAGLGVRQVMFLRPGEPLFGGDIDPEQMFGDLVTDTASGVDTDELDNLFG